MVSKVLSKMIWKAQVGYISSFSVGFGGCRVSHLQFVDDTMIFCNVDVRQLGFFRCILHCIEAMSDLNINLAEKGMFQVGEVSNMDSLT